MDAYPQAAISGTIAEIAGAAEDKTGMFPVEVRFDSVPVSLASGLVAKLNLYPASARTHRLTYVPIASVVEGDGDRASVFIVSAQSRGKAAIVLTDSAASRHPMAISKFSSAAPRMRSA